MTLPLSPPIEPMLARPISEIPPGMLYEPKWDGFRCLVYRDGRDVVLSSRSGRELTRYFPEVVAAVGTDIAADGVFDGELVVVRDGRLDFDQLSDRIHPAARRIERLRGESPALLVCWDILADHHSQLIGLPLWRRRELLGQRIVSRTGQVRLSAATTDISLARRWFTELEGAGLDGILAKDPDSVYQPGKRGWAKIKHSREADVVVAGLRLHRDSTVDRPLVGSLLLGLYLGSELHFVGAVAAFSRAQRAELFDLLSPLEVPSGGDHPWSSDGHSRRPEARSRWAAELKTALLIEPSLVCTVAYDHRQGSRFRHLARLVRWRPDREATSCGFDQLERVPDRLVEAAFAPLPVR